MTDTEAKAQIIATDGFVRSIEWPDPTPKMLDTILFDTIWRVIKSWDINVPNAYSGYMGATGNHARAIYDALAPLLEATEARHAAELRELKERFSEAVCEWRDADTPVKAAKAAARLHDFILPAPDPLVEAEKLISTLRSDEREGYAVAGQAAETISNLIAALRAQQKDTNA